MREWLGAAALGACLAACGPLPTREQRTVFAAPRFDDEPAVAARQVPEQAILAPPPFDAQTQRVLDHWVTPLRERDLDPLTQAFSEDCLVTPWATQGDPEQGTREGRRALRGWLQGHVLSYPYAAVRVVYAGRSARADVDIAALELLDACDTVLLRLDAKLRLAQEHYAAVELRSRELPPTACPR